ncbi:MAG: DNA primase [Alphaproteobacteria bacterium]
MSDLYAFIEELRDKISVADVVGAKVKLTKKGREYVGLCPFHNEKTPSFTVNEQKGFYHCFGCGAHGDIVRFEMEQNGHSFIEAVEKLANIAGLTMPTFKPENKEALEKRKSLYDVMELAVQFFEKTLYAEDGKEALQYLYNRGFGDDIIKKFRLGYAPLNNKLKNLLLSQNVAEKEMQELGLITTPQEEGRKTYDFFRDRVMIPIFDKKKHPIAFGGRVMDGSEPKYLNSPETPIFNKRRILYNMNNAREIAFKSKQLIVCEGYMDVIALDKSGFFNAVAPLGTALTEDQILDAWKIVAEPTLCFDGDNAGTRAAMRSADRALPILSAGKSLKYVFLPEKLDPDEYLKEKGATEFEKFIIQTTPLIDVLWKKNITNVEPTSPEKKALLERNALNDVKEIKDDSIRNYYTQAMKEIIKKELGGGFKSQRNNQPKTVVNDFKVDFDEHLLKRILAIITFAPHLIDRWQEKLATFKINNPELKDLLDNVLEAHNNQETKSNVMIKSFWEYEMLVERNPVDIEKDLEQTMLEIQIKKMDLEIKECMRVIETSADIPEDVYEKYTLCKKEKAELLANISY